MKPDTVGETNIYRITIADESHSGKYTCTGLRKRDFKFSQASESVTLTVSGKNHICLAGHITFLISTMLQ